MSRGTIILIVVLSAALIGLLALPKLLKPTAPANPATPVTATTPASNPAPAPGLPHVATVKPRVPTISTQLTAVPAPTSVNPRIINSDHPPTNAAAADPDAEPPPKPLPVLEREYATTTNRDTRLDLIMDIAENSTADAVKSLTRLFQSETDTDLKVDLLDSLLGIEGFKDEKLIMLTLGTQQGLPMEVRQSAIDGLIDLEDPRTVALLNGLLNDPEEEIREAAQDALDLLQTPPERVVVPTVKPRPK